MQFTKLFNSILDSTIWQEPLETKVVWITMLAMVDRNGEVHASIPGLAKRAGVSLKECQAALACLQSPDEFSRTKDHEGRRVQEIDGGWELLNHVKYRALLSAEERREYNRKKQAEYRAKKKKDMSKDVNDKSITVNHSEQNAHITEAEAEAEADTEGGGEELKLSPPPPPNQTTVTRNPKRVATYEEVCKYGQGQHPPVPQSCCDSFYDRMEECGWITNQGHPIADWRARFRSWATRWLENEKSNAMKGR